jgi:RNA polymerase sigma factor (sigma-70 family)
MNLTNQQITDLWNEYYPRVYGYFFKRITSQTDVDDLTSVTLTGFIQNLTTKEITQPAGLLWKIARNQLYLYIKYKTKNPISIDNLDEFEALETTEDSEISQKYQDLLEEVMQKAEMFLTADDLTILKRSYFEEQTSTQIAKELDTTPGNIRIRLMRITQKLKLQANNLIN